MAETVGQWYWLVLIMGIWVVASLGIGAKAIFFDPEKGDEKNQ